MVTGWLGGELKASVVAPIRIRGAGSGITVSRLPCRLRVRPTLGILSSRALRSSEDRSMPTARPSEEEAGVILERSPSDGRLMVIKELDPFMLLICWCLPESERMKCFLEVTVRLGLGVGSLWLWRSLGEHSLKENLAR